MRHSVSACAKRQLLPGACHRAVLLVPGVQGEVGDATLDLEEDGVEGQSKLEARKSVPLVEACAARKLDIPS